MIVSNFDHTKEIIMNDYFIVIRNGSRTILPNGTYTEIGGKGVEVAYQFIGPELVILRQRELTET